MPRRIITGFPVQIDEYVNVEKLGAQGDGTTDDTAEFQAAIDRLESYGGIIQVPEGNFIATAGSLNVGAKDVFWILNGQVNSSYDPAGWPGTIINNGGTATTTLPASSITVVDTADWFTGTDVEAILAEIGAALDGLVAGVVPDGDYGDITVAGGVWGIDASTITTAKIVDDAVTLAKMEHGTSGDVLYYGASGVPFRLAKGADDQVLTLASGLPSWATPAGTETIIYRGTAVATTSGTSVDIAWPSPDGSNVELEIVLSLSGVSTSGTSGLLAQLGDAGGIEATGYASYADEIEGGLSSSTAGFILTPDAVAARTYTGRVVFNRIDGEEWVSSGTIIPSTTSDGVVVNGGSKTLSANITTIRLTTVGGTDTFDAGKINYLVKVGA